jgi:hypothetical protein
MERFKRAQFDEASPDELIALCDELVAYLSDQLRGRDFHEAVYDLIGKLNSEGHDFWSQDEDDEFHVWGPNYESPRPGGGLVITFSKPDQVTVEPVSA